MKSFWVTLKRLIFLSNAFGACKNRPAPCIHQRSERGDLPWIIWGFYLNFIQQGVLLAGTKGSFCHCGHGMLIVIGSLDKFFSEMQKSEFATTHNQWRSNDKLQSGAFTLSFWQVFQLLFHTLTVKFLGGGGRHCGVQLASRTLFRRCRIRRGSIVDTWTMSLFKIEGALIWYITYQSIKNYGFRPLTIGKCQPTMKRHQNEEKDVLFGLSEVASFQFLSEFAKNQHHFHLLGYGFQLCAWSAGPPRCESLFDPWAVCGMQQGTHALRGQEHFLFFCIPDWWARRLRRAFSHGQSLVVLVNLVDYFLWFTYVSSALVHFGTYTSVTFDSLPSAPYCTGWSL